MKKYDVCFVISARAYLVEALAYNKFLNENGISSIVCDIESLVDARLYYRFGGFLNKKISKDSTEIHEYHTISTGSLVWLKNLIKSYFSVKPVYLSFLNEAVENAYFFSTKLPRFYRDMGAEKSLLEVRSKGSQKQFDICYFGALSNRAGVIERIVELSNQGFAIVVGGKANAQPIAALKQAGVTYVGVCDRNHVHHYLSVSRFGLNIMPNEYPLNIQTSTKVIEYLVAGLPIISNSYEWIEEHSKNHGYSYIDINNVVDFGDCNWDEYVIPECIAETFTWESILEQCNFLEIIKGVINDNQSSSSHNGSNHS